MKLTSTQIEQTLGQFEAEPIPEDHPMVPLERDPISYALETDWPAGAAGFEPLHLGCNSPKTPSQGVRIRTLASWNQNLSSGRGPEFAYLELQVRGLVLFLVAGEIMERPRLSSIRGLSVPSRVGRLCGRTPQYLSTDGTS